LRRTLGGADAGAASFMEVERAELKFYLGYLREGMTVFDAGANVGELTLLFSKFVGEGRVHAFEASADAFARLNSVCHAAGRCNVVLNHLALSDREGTARLHVYGGKHLSWSSLAARPLENYGIDAKPLATETVAATTVDGYCEQHGVARIDLLKIDVEGAEYQVLLGARRMLRQKLVGCVAFEFGQTTFDMGNDPGEIESYVKAMGYTLRNVVPGDPVFPGRAGVQSACYSMHIATP
jgi:FkbM family methyltransferase